MIIRVYLVLAFCVINVRACKKFCWPKGGLVDCTKSAQCARVMKALDQQPLREIRVLNCKVKISVDGVTHDTWRQAVNVRDKRGDLCEWTKTSTTTSKNPAGSHISTPKNIPEPRQTPQLIFTSTTTTVLHIVTPKGRPESALDHLRKMIRSAIKRAEDSDDRSLTDESWGFLTWGVVSTVGIILILTKRWLRERCKGQDLDGEHPNQPDQPTDQPEGQPNQPARQPVGQPVFSTPNISQIPLLHTPPSCATTLTSGETTLEFVELEENDGDNGSPVGSPVGSRTRQQCVKKLAMNR